MRISFTEAAKVDSALTPPPSPDSALQGAAPKKTETNKKEVKPPTEEPKGQLVPQEEIPEPSPEDDISDDTFDDSIGGFDPNNPGGAVQDPPLPITVATEYISQLKDIKTNLDRMSSISFNLSIDLNEKSLAKKNFIESQIAEANSLYDIMATGVKELKDKLPELIKSFHEIIDNIYKELKSLNMEYGVVKTKSKIQKTDLKKNKKDK